MFVFIFLAFGAIAVGAFANPRFVLRYGYWRPRPGLEQLPPVRRLDRRRAGFLTALYASVVIGAGYLGHQFPPRIGAGLFTAFILWNLLQFIRLRRAIEIAGREPPPAGDY